MLMPPPMLLWLIAAAVLATLALAFALAAWQRESAANVIRATPTLSAADVAERYRFASIGAAAFGEPIELSGTLASDEPLIAPYSHTPCVAYDFSVSEEQERRVGSVRSGRIQETNGFDTHAQRVQRCYVVDDTGRVAVDLAGAQLELIETVARYERYTGLKGEEREIWREEWALPLGRPVYVLGYLATSEHMPLVARHPLDSERPFLVSHRAEEAVQRRTRGRAYLFYLLAGLSGGAAGVCLLAGLGVI